MVLRFRLLPPNTILSLSIRALSVRARVLNTLMVQVLRLMVSNGGHAPLGGHEMARNASAGLGRSLFALLEYLFALPRFIQPYLISSRDERECYGDD
jgi:hypothetical protein